MLEDIDHGDQGGGGTESTDTRTTVEEHRSAHYISRMRESLPPEVFQRDRSRLVWLALHFALAGGGTSLIALGIGGLWVAIPAAIAIGVSFSALCFVAHEILHGAVVKNRTLQLLLGGLAFLPFTLSPRLWVAWHNRAHHGNTMKANGDDPDAGGTLSDYRASPSMRFFDHLTVGRWRPAGVFLFLIGFNGQSLRVLLSMARRLDYLSPRQFALAVAETLAGVAFWAAVAFVIGPRAFLFAFIIPLAIGNAIVMSYILTNHNLSPFTKLNDPLLNSLSVTTPRALAFVHLNFGLHVEHHLFPTMSSSHAPIVRDELLRRWPERYQSMPLLRALVHLWSTARIYSDNNTLYDPRSGKRWPALLPRR